MSKQITVERQTKETDIKLEIALDGKREVKINTTIPFFDHLLTAMGFHGGFSVSLKASGDTEIDFHHLVEDTGIVYGMAFHKLFEETGSIRRFGEATIPMDESRSRCVIDVSGRPFCHYEVEYPQPLCKDFEMALLHEFFLGFTNNAAITLHLIGEAGKNSHHIAESLFKAFGKALAIGYTPMGKNEPVLSTKGVI